jgi:hypothetical protein
VKRELNYLENLRDKIEDKILEREWAYDERSEKWQDSDKGNTYLEKTEELHEIKDNIELAIDSIETYLEI